MHLLQGKVDNPSEFESMSQVQARTWKQFKSYNNDNNETPDCLAKTFLEMLVNWTGVGKEVHSRKRGHQQHIRPTQKLMV